ncbi:MAG: ABC-F family ATP-binding cassette domain-containing protein [Candidatus Omnitrophica bacterium]|nr:ABC-F family ATP-binding cassette domain-containing protein [Candidatus Omnitrophota bacterium]
MIELKDVSLTFGHQPILESVSWKVNDGERVAIVGKNGAGKSTLLKMMAGSIRPDEGDVSITGKNTVGYLEQDVTLKPGRTVWEEALEGKDEILSLEREMRRYEEILSSLEADSSDLERRLNRYSQLQHEFEEKGGYKAESEAGAILSGLGFTKDRWEEPTENFSGGWQVRLHLAKLLLRMPDILLLDEPTNYLDLENIQWVESFIKDYPGSVVLVSHDRTLMNNVVNRVSEIAMRTISDYKGNYDSYLEERERRYEVLENAAKNQQKKIRQTERFIERFKAKSTKASQARSRMKQLEKMEIIETPREDATIRVILPKVPRSGKEVVRIKEVSRTYNGRTVFEPYTATFYRGDRIALVGENGAGKSTLMRIIAGKDEGFEGKVEVGASVFPRYFAQDQIGELSPEASVLAEAEAEAPPEWVPRVRDFLGSFLFRGDDVFKKTAVLSGGEKSRLCLSKILCGTANLLLLDEPTNHLDLITKERLLAALDKYEGTIVFVSHDRHFLRGLATRIVEIQEGVVNDYPWGYDDYVWWKEENEEELKSR